MFDPPPQVPPSFGRSLDLIAREAIQSEAMLEELPDLINVQPAGRWSPRREEMGGGWGGFTWMTKLVWGRLRIHFTFCQCIYNWALV